MKLRRLESRRIRPDGIIDFVTTSVYVKSKEDALTVCGNPGKKVNATFDSTTGKYYVTTPSGNQVEVDVREVSECRDIPEFFAPGTLIVPGLPFT